MKEAESMDTSNEQVRTWMIVEPTPAQKAQGYHSQVVTTDEPNESNMSFEAFRVALFLGLLP